METIVRADQQKADLLEERLIDFAVRIIRLSARLPKTPAGRHVAGQILRCGTSPAANYSEARAAESHADFLHKLRVVLKELNETMGLAPHGRKERVDCCSNADRDLRRKFTTVPNPCVFCEHGEIKIKSGQSEYQMITDH